MEKCSLRSGEGQQQVWVHLSDLRIEAPTVTLNVLTTIQTDHFSLGHTRAPFPISKEPNSNSLPQWYCNINLASAGAAGQPNLQQLSELRDKTFSTSQISEKAIEREPAHISRWGFSGAENPEGWVSDRFHTDHAGSNVISPPQGCAAHNGWEGIFTAPPTQHEAIMLCSTFLSTEFQLNASGRFPLFFFFYVFGGFTLDFKP